MRGAVATLVDCGGEAARHGPLFWRTVLREECHAMGAGSVHDKHVMMSLMTSLMTPWGRAPCTTST